MNIVKNKINHYYISQKNYKNPIKTCKMIVYVPNAKKKINKKPQNRSLKNKK